MATKPKNHRRGRMRDGKPGEPAVFEPGAAAANPGRSVPAPATEPRRTKAARYPPYDKGKAEEYARGCPAPVGLDWLAERSPAPVPSPGEQGRETAELFLQTLFETGENILLLTDRFSQGDYLFTVGQGTKRLGATRDAPAEESALPIAGDDGVMFLPEPVTGEWAIYQTIGESRWGRRHSGCVAAWRYLLVESVSAPPDIWIRILARLPLPISAIWTAGSRTVAALVRVDCGSKSEFNAARDVVMGVIAILGADPRAASGVRLACLPGCRHQDRLNRLVWLDPEGAGPIVERFR